MFLNRRATYVIASIMMGWVMGCQQGSAYLSPEAVACSGPSCPGSCSTNADCPSNFATCYQGTCYNPQPVVISSATTTGTTTSTTSTSTGFTTGATGGGNSTAGTTGGGTAGSTAGGTAGTTTSQICEHPNACGDCLLPPACTADVYGDPNASTGGGNTTGGTTSVAASQQGGQTPRLPTPDPTSQVFQAPDGSITLVASQSSVLANEFAWAANSVEGTISSVDTRSAVETGRYPTVLRINGVPAVPGWGAQCNQPSRTAVDPNGNGAYVTNRNNSDDGWIYGPCRNSWVAGTPIPNWDQGSVTKIARYDAYNCDPSQNATHDLSACSCIDRNNDNVITTSKDIDGDGIIYMGTCTGTCNVTCSQDSECTNPSTNNDPSASSTAANAKWCVHGYCSTATQCAGACTQTCQSAGDCHDPTAPYCNYGTCSTKPQEYFGYGDECVMWTTVLPTFPGTGHPGALGRGTALDAAGNLWVGDYRHPRMYKINSQTGALIDPTGGNSQVNAQTGVVMRVAAYGAIIDGHGIISAVDRGAQIDQINSATGQLVYPNASTPVAAAMLAGSPAGGYGITIDGQSRVWVPSYAGSCWNVPTILRFDPSDANGYWATFQSSADPNDFTGGGGASVWCGRGATTDTVLGVVWAVYNGSYSPDPNRPPNWLVGFDINTGQMVQKVRTDVDGSGNRLACSTPIGVGIGANNGVWLVAQGDNTVCGYDPISGIWHVVTVGTGPYTYSDFTGNIYREFTAANSGVYSLTFQGCTSSSYNLLDWQSLSMDGLAPGGSEIQLSFRTANTVNALNSATWTPPVVFNAASGSPSTFPLSVDPLSYLQVQFTLIKGSAQTNNLPTLQSVTVARHCAFVGGG